MANHILQNDSKVLLNLMGKLDELRHLNALFAQSLINSELAKHCKVAKYDEKNCLIVIVDNGNWATQLRFHIPDLMAKLRKHAGLEKLSGIICKTRPNTATYKIEKPTKRDIAKVSPQTADTVLETAKAIRDTRLRGILERLAMHLKEESI